MLPPANIAEVSSSSNAIIHNSWWDYDFSNTDNKINFSDSKKITKELFEQAVKNQMVSDVPLGSYLSGGMDSGSITAIASKQVSRLATFTCGFDMNEVSGIEANFDERRDAEFMANHFKTEQYEQVMNSDDIKWCLPKLVYHLEDLRAGMSYILIITFLDWLLNLLRLVFKVLEVTNFCGGYPWRYYRVFDSLTKKDFNQYYNFWQRLVPDDQKLELFTKDVINQIDDINAQERHSKGFLLSMII